MPTLLQFNTTLNYGSTGRIAEDIGLTARRIGWECYIAHGPRMKNESRLRALQVSSSLDEKIHGGWYSLLCDRHGLGSERATKKFIERLQSEIKPDIIHLHNIHGYYLNYRVLFEYLRKTDIPIVWTLHDCWPFTGHCTYFDFAGCGKWRTECRDCSQLGTYPRALFMDNSTRNYRLKRALFSSVADRMTIVPVSDWLGDLVKQSFLNDAKIRVIHNGIDIEAFHPYEDTGELRAKYRLNGKRIVLGVASPWSERKGLPDFVKLRELLPQQEYAIVLVGVSQEQIARLPASVIGIRRTLDIGELAGWYSLADVFVNPTYEDNYPTTNLEAMACGTPVITYRTGGSPESVTPATGRVVTQGDLRGLVTAIGELADESRENLRIACRDRAGRCFDRRMCFQAYVDLYQELINE